MILAPLVAMLPIALASGADLGAAYDRGDLDELARLGGQLGAAGIAPLFDGPHAGAAIAAAADAPDGWELLGDLARIAQGWDRARAAPAARVAARLAAHLGDAGERDLPDDVLADAGAAWAAIAARPDRWADVRVHALEVAAQVARARHAGLGYDLGAMLADRDPELRRAAAELVASPIPDDTRAPLAAAIANDGAPLVALAAAQALCGELASDDPAATLATLGAGGLARLRALATAPPGDAPAPALLDAARCLAADRDPASATALRSLTTHAPRSIRAALAKLRP